MSADEFAIRRIELDAETTVWVPDQPAVGAGTPELPPARPTARVSPAVAGAAASVAGLALVRLGPSREGVLAAWVLGVLAVLTAIDLRERRLPNRIVFPAMLCAVVWQAAFFPGRLVECLLAGLAAGALLLLPSLIQPRAVGMGDVKVAAFLGVVLGTDVIVALLAGSLASAPVALAILLVGGAGARRSSLPYGPFLALGAGIALLV
jgi:leader peptidase (prepilin peptidase)/N-methyltransferase